MRYLETLKLKLATFLAPILTRYLPVLAVLKRERDEAREELRALRRELLLIRPSAFRVSPTCPAYDTAVQRMLEKLDKVGLTVPE